MKMKCFLSIVLLLWYFPLIAQSVNQTRFIKYINLGEKAFEISPIDAEKYLDSANALKSSIKTDEPLVKFLVFEAGVNYKQHDYKTAIIHLKAAEKRIKTSDSQTKTTMLMRFANAYEKLDDFNSSWKYWQAAENYTKKQKDTIGWSKVLIKMGDYAYYHFNPAVSSSYYFKALNLAEKIDLASVQSEALASIGYIYEKNFQSIKALRFYRKSLKIAKSANDDKNAINVLSYLSQIYGDQFKNKEKALFYMHEREQLLENTELNNEKYRLNADYALIYYSSKEYKKALFFYHKALLFAKKANTVMEVSRTYYNLGLTYKDSKDFKNAQLYYDSAVYLGVKHNDLNRLWYAYYDLAYLNAEKGNHQLAFDYFEKYTLINDQVLDEGYQSNLNELNIQYETAKKDARNKILLKNSAFRKLQLEKQRKQNVYLWLILFLVVLVLLIGVYAFVRLKKQHSLLRVQRDEIEQKTKMLNQQALEISKFRTQMNPHFIFNALNSVQHFILKENKNNALGYLHDLSRLMRITLYNSDKEFITLQEEHEFIAFYVHFEQQRYEHPVQFDWVIDPSIEEDVTMIIPMVLQPLIENSFKHGGFSQINQPKITVTFQKVNELLKIRLEDNGCGFKVSASNAIHESKGIEITRKRLEALFSLNAIDYQSELLRITNKSSINSTETGCIVEIILPFKEQF